MIKSKSKISKRVLTLVLVVAMVFCYLPSTFAASDTSETDTSLTLSLLPFTDVSDATAWYYADVIYVYENNVMIGKGNNEFAPDETVIRGQFVKAISNMAEELGYDTSGYLGSDKFNDIDTDAYYNEATGWAYENEILEGTGDNYANPDGYVTREEMATFLYRYAEFLGYELDDSVNYTYADNDKISDWAADAVVALSKGGIFNGMEVDGVLSFYPEEYSTRAQMAALLHRLLDGGMAPVEGALTIVDVTYAQVTGAGNDLTDNAQIVDSYTLSGSYASVTLIDNSQSEPEQELKINGTESFTVPDDYLATLTIDGVEYGFMDQKGTTIDESSEVVITYTKEMHTITNNGPGEGNGITESFRAGLYVEDGTVVDESSVLTAAPYTATSTGISDIAITSLGDLFNGIMINGTGSDTYKISNANIDFTGNGGDDFQGWGAGIMIYGDSDVEISQSYLITEGAIRSAIWASGNSSLNVTNTVIVGLDADTDSESFQNLKVPMMTKVPWALGLEGNNRITNVLGAATATYTESIVVAEGWGALSSDSASSTSGGLKDVNDVLSGIGYLEEAVSGKDYTATKTVNGVTYGFTVGELGENSGYVTYADQGITNEYTSSEFYAPDYIGIIAAGGSGMTMNDITAESQRGGFMFHQTSGGKTTLNEGSFTATDALFIIKSQLSDSSGSSTAYTDIEVNGTDIDINGDNAQSGTLLMLIPTDDTAGSPVAGTYTVPYEGVDTEKSSETINDVNATFTDTDVEGNIYNAMQYKEQALNVTFSDSTIEGVITSSYDYHVDENGNQYAEGTYLDDTMEGAYLYGGRVVNVASPTVDNPVNLTLTNNSTWKVSGTSYLSSLTVDSTSTIEVPTDYKIFVDGTETTVADIIAAGGTVTGEIIISESIANILYVADGDTYTLTETESYDAVAIGTGATIEAATGYYVTLTVDGVEKSILADTTYTGNVVLTPTKDLFSENSDWAGFRAAVYIDDNGINSDYSAISAIVSGNVTDSGATNAVMRSETDLSSWEYSFNGIFVNVGTEQSTNSGYTLQNYLDGNIPFDYSITNADIEYTGPGGNDFLGFGASVMATGDSKVLLQGSLAASDIEDAADAVKANPDVDLTDTYDTNINNEGQVRTTLVAEESSTVVVDSAYTKASDGQWIEGYIASVNTSIMKSVPWMLGLYGNVRANNLLDNATGIYYNSIIEGENWGVISTDESDNVQVEVQDSIVRGTGISTYGLYSIGNAEISVTDSYLFVPTYAVISANGGNTTVFKDTEIYSERAGAMYHSSSGSYVTFEDSIVNVGREFAIMRGSSSTYFNVVVDNSDISFKNSSENILVQLMDNDDILDGSTMRTTVDYVDPAFEYGDNANSLATATDYYNNLSAVASASNSSTATFKDATVAGDIYNSAVESGQVLDVVLDNAELTGTVSSSVGLHDKETLVSVWNENGQTGSEDYKLLGKLTNYAFASIGNDVNVSLTNTSTWKVTGAGYLSSLYVESGSTIEVPSGYVIEVGGTQYTTFADFMAAYAGQTVNNVVIK